MISAGKKLVLASGSPRRKILLGQIGLTFEVRESGVDESIDVGDNPATHVTVLSQQKASAVADGYDDAIIIGADTVVVLDGKIIGKPSDEREAEVMLNALSGRWHEVYTGFTLVDRPSDRQISRVEMTKVKFRKLADSEIAEYVRSGSPMDKAGAYGIQDDYGAVFVERIEGCFYTVVGFPLTKFYVTLKEFLS
jgi:septum formation protein